MVERNFLIAFVDNDSYPSDSPVEGLAANAGAAPTEKSKRSITTYRALFERHFRRVQQKKFLPRQRSVREEGGGGSGGSGGERYDRRCCKPGSAREGPRSGIGSLFSSSAVCNTHTIAFLCNTTLIPGFQASISTGPVPSLTN